MKFSCYKYLIVNKMKKLSLIVAMACLFMVACTNNTNNGKQEEPATTEQTCDQQKQCPFAAIDALFADWDNMTDEAKAEALKSAKAKIDEMDACGQRGGHPGCKPEDMKSCCPKCVEGCCKEGKCICENCPCDCMKDGKCTMEPGKPCCKEGKPGDKPCCKEGMPEMTEEMKAEMEAKRAEMEAKMAELKEQWDNFDNLSIDDQKAAIDTKIEMMKCHKGPKGDKPCDKPAE